MPSDMGRRKTVSKGVEKPLFVSLWAAFSLPPLCFPMRCISKSVHQFIISPIERHSKKPDEAREKILELMGDIPRIELLARQTPPGWDVWGNEVASDITLAERS